MRMIMSGLTLILSIFATSCSLGSKSTLIPQKMDAVVSQKFSDSIKSISENERLLLKAYLNHHQDTTMPVGVTVGKAIGAESSGIGCYREKLVFY